MFIDSSTISRLAPFEGAEEALTSYYSKIAPLLRTEPERGFALSSIDISPLPG